MITNLIKERPKTLVGFWDTRYESFKLGSVCTFLNNLQCYAKVKKYATIRVAFIDKNNFQSHSLVKNDVKDDWISIIFDCLDLSSIPIYKSYEQFFHKHKYQDIFPTSDICMKLISSNNKGNFYNIVTRPFNLYNSNKITQKLYSDYNVSPHLKFNQTKTYLTNLKQDKKKTFISVHLKNVCKGDTQSNANFFIWQKFLELYSSSDICFLLIGSDPIPQRIKNLDHVISLHDENVPLIEQLSCIQQSTGFMGMSSGPASVAILSPVPYIIFKHPNHHPDIMWNELGGSIRYNFSTPNQSFLREYESIERLTTFIKELSIYENV